jgi:hypothetical protein
VQLLAWVEQQRSPLDTYGRGARIQLRPSFLQASFSASSLACRAMQPAAFMGSIGTKKKTLLRP